MKNNIMKNAMGTIVDVTVGSAVMGAVSGSSMPQGFKDVTNVGISAGIMGRAFKRSGLGRHRKGDFF